VIRIVLVDDQQVVRPGVRALAERDGDITVVGEAAAGWTGLSRDREVRPDVVLMVIRMPKLDGLEETRQIVEDQQPSDVRVLVLTTCARWRPSRIRRWTTRPCGPDRART
jgi:DNA-binding NarL/FixJ family response regulator